MQVLMYSYSHARRRKASSKRLASATPALEDSSPRKAGACTDRKLKRLPARRLQEQEERYVKAHLSSSSRTCASAFNMLSPLLFLAGIVILPIQNAEAQFPPKPEDVKVVQSKFHEGIKISYKEVSRSAFISLQFLLTAVWVCIFAIFIVQRPVSNLLARLR